MYPIINNIALSYNLMEHYLSPFLQKNEIKRCCKRSHYVTSLESSEPTEEVAYSHCQIFINYYFFAKVKF
jgi:hypothetical protein